MDVAFLRSGSEQTRKDRQTDALIAILRRSPVIDARSGVARNFRWGVRQSLALSSIPVQLPYQVGRTLCAGFVWSLEARLSLIDKNIDTSNGFTRRPITLGNHILKNFSEQTCAVGTTDCFLSSMSPFMCVESNSGVADPGAAAARLGTRVVEWLCAELPDCSSMLKS